MIRKILMIIFLRLLVPKKFHKVKKEKIEQMFRFIVKQEELEDFENFLDQCIDGAKNKFLINPDPMFKGMVASYVEMKEALIKAKKKLKEEIKKRDGKNESSVKYPKIPSY